ncbi:MAG: hypothetical protein ACYSU1_04475 [Planctomycetota bacterium]|jgi:hypothetical protein
MHDNVPFQGGFGSGPSGTDYRSQRESVDPFVIVNGATGIQLAKTPGQASRYESLGTVAAPIHYWYLHYGGHSWPGHGSEIGDPVNMDIDANDESWRFFAQFLIHTHRSPTGSASRIHLMPFAVVVLAATVLLMSTGCASTENLSEHGYGSMTIRHSTTPGEVDCNRLFDLVIRIDGPEVEAVEMEGLHPATRVGLLDPPAVERTADGSWVAPGLLLHLPGTWEIEIHMHYNGRVRHHTIRMEV